MEKFAQNGASMAPYYSYLRRNFSRVPSTTSSESRTFSLILICALDGSRAVSVCNTNKPCIRKFRIRSHYFLLMYTYHYILGMDRSLLSIYRSIAIYHQACSVLPVPWRLGACYALQLHHETVDYFEEVGHDFNLPTILH